MTRLFLSILASVLLSFLFASWVGAYEPDFVDRERVANWRAMRSHDCYWHPETCRSHRRKWPSRGFVYGARKPFPHSDIMAAQIRLREWGYRVEVDGLLGPETRYGVMAFQRDNDIAVTGELDRYTMAVLKGERGRENRKETWSRRPELCREDNGRECTCDPIIVFSGEHTFKDAEAEAMKRWRGHVRALLGETFMSWKGNPVPVCWYTGTGERTSDRLGQTRCVFEARACFDPPAPEDAGPVIKRPARD